MPPKIGNLGAISAIAAIQSSQGYEQTAAAGLFGEKPFTKIEGTKRPASKILPESMIRWGMPGK